VLRAEQRLRPYVILSAVTGISTAVFTAILVIIFQLSVTGWFLAVIAANALTLLASFRLIPWGRLDEFDREGVTRAVKLGLTLVPHGLSLWALALADRLLLAGIVSASALGVYTLGANLALPAIVVIQSLNQGFMPSYARSRGAPERADELREVITLQLLLIFAIGCAVALLAAPIVGFLSPAYRQGAEIVPWLVLGYVFTGLYQVPMNLISLISGKTGYVWVLGLTATVVSLGAILLAVPSQGIIAAGWASALGYFVLFLMTCVYAYVLKLRPRLDWKRIGVGSVLAIGTFGLGSFLPGSGVLSVMLRGLFIVGLFIALGVLAGIKLETVRRRIRSMP
jgi:O-antigen/teichoic acid export membrane protein